MLEEARESCRAACHRFSSVVTVIEAHDVCRRFGVHDPLTMALSEVRLS
jgi:hypothetical protein